MTNRIFILIVVSLMFFCSKAGKDIAGTTTETTTGAAIEGLIVYSDSAPVVGASVILHDQRLVKLISLSKRSALVRSGTTETNINGFFHFNSVDTGGYFVEINDHDSLGALLNAQVKPKDTLVECNGVLKRLGSIIGKVDLRQITVIDSIKIYLPEINIKVAVDSSGNFTITNLPGWNYVIRVTVGDSIIRFPNDTVRVPVVSGDTTRISQFGAETGTITISSKIIENPHNQ